MNATTETVTTTVTVESPNAAAMSRTAQQAIALVQSFEVVDAGTYELAADELKSIKQRAAKLDEQRKAITKPLDEAKKAVMDLFRAPLELLNQAEGIIKGKMLAYQQEEQRKANEARIAAERAAQEERERLQREAEALKSEGKAGEAMLKETVAAMVVPAAVAAPEPAKVAGIATRKTVEFEVVDLHALVVFIAQRPELIGLLESNDTAMRQYVRGLGMNTKLPGVRVFEKETLAARR